MLRLDKQVPVLAESLRYAVIAMPGRDRQWVFYLARGLPFGGSGSVFSFNKVIESSLARRCSKAWPSDLGLCGRLPNLGSKHRL